MILGMNLPSKESKQGYINVRKNMLGGVFLTPRLHIFSLLELHF
jgi:hypothetical protein